MAMRNKRYSAFLRDGELALGHVISQQIVAQGRASYSRIEYQFKDNSGQVFDAFARDLTNSAFEEMTIPGFYDPGNPSKNITPCATYLQISCETL